VFVEAPAGLEDDDVLEMVNAGLAPITIVDDYLAEFWTKVFTISRCTRTSRCGQAATWPSRFARRIPSSERSSTRGSRRPCVVGDEPGSRWVGNGKTVASKGITVAHG